MIVALPSPRRCAECGQPKKLSRHALCFRCDVDKQVRESHMRGYNEGFSDGLIEGYTRAEREWVELRNGGGLG